MGLGIRRSFPHTCVHRNYNPEVVEQSYYAANHQNEDQRPDTCGSAGGHHIELGQESSGDRNSSERKQHERKNACQHRLAPEQAGIVFQSIGVPFFIGKNCYYSKCADSSYEVRHQVEGDRFRSHAAARFKGDQKVAHVGNGRVSQNPLDVGLQ